MDEIECTALDADWDVAPHPLMHPQCMCPRCTPDPLAPKEDRDGWLRVSGERRRFRVELHELGPTGQDLLG